MPVNQATITTFFQSVPLLILGGCLFISAATALAVFWLMLQSAKVRSQINKLARAFNLDNEASHATRRDGLPLSTLDEIRNKCSTLDRPAADWWRHIDSATESYTGPQEQTGWFLTERAPNLLSYNAVISRNVSSAFFSAVPGLLTGVGLALTFTAILIALKDVIVPDDPTGPIVGIRPLINGLSGKFLSSIVALALSILFTLYEKGQLSRLRRAYDQLIAAIERAIPFLPASRILIDTQRLAANRTVHVETIGAEVVDKYIEAFNARVVPAFVAGISAELTERIHSEAGSTIERMTGTLESLQAAIAGFEPQKQNSSTTDIHGLATSLETPLAEVLNGLILKLQESADQNLSSVRSQMTMVIGDLSDRVGELSRDMMAAAGNAARQSQACAHEVLEQTGHWSEVTAKRLDTLMASMEARTTDFQKAAEGLLQARTFVVDVINQNANALSRMADASRHVQSYSSGLAEQAETLKAITANQSVIAHQLREASASVSSSFEQNQVLLGEHRRLFQSYQSVIDELDSNLAKILSALNTGLTDYNHSMENNFTAVVKISNEMVPDISKFLTSQMTELGDQFEELGSVISHSVERIDGRIKQP